MLFSPDDSFFLAPEEPVIEAGLGQFARGILLLVLHEPESPGNRDFLIKILSAAQINPEKDTFWIESTNPNGLSVISFLKEKQAETVLVLGFTPQQIGLQTEIPCYIPTPFYNTIWLFSEPLSVLEPDKTRKGLLWKALQQCFLK
ncbi:MAG: hypothetical protein KGS48_18230 [Bacteroidetes bacterium]|nr:hypothetical protein [Bacteroidota bacterium]